MRFHLEIDKEDESSEQEKKWKNKFMAYGLLFGKQIVRYKCYDKANNLKPYAYTWCSVVRNIRPIRTHTLSNEPYEHKKMSFFCLN